MEIQQETETKVGKVKETTPVKEDAVKKEVPAKKSPSATNAKESLSRKRSIADAQGTFNLGRFFVFTFIFTLKLYSLGINI